MIRAALFDLDGTLVNTEPTYWAAWRKIFAPLGVELEDSDFRAVMGRRPVEVATIFLQKTAHDATAEEISEALIAEMLNDTSRVLMAGAREAVELARESGLRLAVATSSPLRLAEVSLESGGLRDYFEVVVSSEFEVEGKPNPAVFLTAARKLDIDPGHCVVIEDAPNGVLAAKAAGMRCIVVAEPGHRDNPVNSQANVKLATLEQLTREHLIGATSFT